jgi:hypothetical protein
LARRCSRQQRLTTKKQPPMATDHGGLQWVYPGPPTEVVGACGAGWGGP